jgi:hypothetical protein
MPKKPKPKRRNVKPGPREERLVIRDNPTDALARLLRKKVK